MNEVSTGADEGNRSRRHEDLVLISSRTDEDLVVRLRLGKRRTRSRIGLGILSVHHQRSSPSGFGGISCLP